MIDTLRVAAISIESRPGETARNLGLIRSWCQRAAAEQAQLVIFPELSVTGFVPNHPLGDHSAWLRTALAGARRMAEPLAGKAVAALVEMAVATGLYVAAGLLEDSGNLLHNAMVLAGPEGLAGVWRKMHIPMFEMPFYGGGPAPVVADTAVGRIGANICFDALLPESTRLVAVQNAEIVLFPFAADPPPGTAAAWADWAGPVLRARCVENGVFGVACNYLGPVEFAGVEQTFPGGAMIVGPAGTVMAEQRSSGDAPMLLADLRAESLLDARAQPEYLFRFRRPELYRALAE